MKVVPMGAKNNKPSMRGWVFYIPFICIFAMLLVFAIVSIVISEDAAKRFVAPVIIMFFGATWLSGIYLNVRYYGYGDVIGIGRVSWRHRRGLYILFTFLLSLVGLVPFVVGVVLLVRALL